MTKVKERKLNKSVDGLPEGWRETTLGEVVVFVNEKIEIEKIDLDNYISTENLLPNKLGVQKATTLPNISKVNNFKKQDTLFSNIRTYFKKVWFANFDGGSSNDVLIFRPIDEDVLDKKLLYYLISSDKFINFTTVSAKGTKMPRGDKEAIKTFKINLPPISQQKAIAGVLSAFDDKIELLREQNEILEKIGETIFKEWFGKYSIDDKLPDGWRVGRLSEIADFLNGLALQKYSPKQGEKNLPVIKIRELKQGITENTDRANTDLDEKYIIKNGDILFSWSGSLEVVIWKHGKGALNQHLFKVTSENYPKWFYYFWTVHHLKEFKNIAANKATTMGHINRRHLDDAVVFIPDNKTMDKIGKIISPVLEKFENNNSQIQTLSKTRDTLLPKLMKGEIILSDNK